MEEPVFINPFTDFGFKKIFGEEQNKDLLIDFLNELLATQNQHISDLTFKKTDRLGSTDLDRKVVFDLYCENQQGEKFTVELQKAKQSFFKDRMLYYSSFSVQEQGLKGNWDYQLKAIYVIAILDFIMDEDNSDKIVVSKNKMMDIERYKVFYDKLTFVTLQMPNFSKEEHEWLVLGLEGAEPLLVVILQGEVHSLSGEVSDNVGPVSTPKGLNPFFSVNSFEAIDLYIK
jgi:predicted transposase/invertase (TIGR01784 family)